MSQLFKNNAKSRLSSDLAANALSFNVTLNTGQLFPVIASNSGDHFDVTLEDSMGEKEIIRIVNRVDDTFTVGISGSQYENILGRGRESTLTRGFKSGDLVELRLTSGYIDAIKEGSLMYVIDGGSDAITPGIKGFIEAPFNGTIKQVKLFADAVGSITIDIFKDTWDNYNPDENSADSICGNSTNPIVLNSNMKNIASLTGWNLYFSKGDIFYFDVISASVISRVTISMIIDRF